MADLPRDKPHSERDRVPASELPGEIGGREIIAYLRRHPDFLDSHPEALRLLRAPTREIGEDVVDFQHFQIERLRRDLARVNLEHRTLIAASRGNLASQGRVHKAVIAILAAPSFEQLLQTVTTDLAVLLDVDVVTIGVESTAAPAGRLSLNGIQLLKAGAVDALIGPERAAKVFITCDRRQLVARIETRFAAMLKAGALDEVRALAARRLDPLLPAMKAHGVPWLIRHLNGEISLDEAAEGSIMDTRRYAKRQVTWFRNQMKDWPSAGPDEAQKAVESQLAGSNLQNCR